MKFKTITPEGLAFFKETTKHCLFGPSSLGQIKQCPASALETLNNPYQKESIWAAAGTRLHSIMEKAMVLDPIHYLNTEAVYEEDNEKPWCLDNAEFALEIYNEHKTVPTVALETEVNLNAFGVPEVEGTSDLVYKSPFRLDVVDWKFGSGIQVFATNNIQGACYAGGVLGNHPTFEGEIHIWIAQAPLNHYDEWVVTPRELRELMVDQVWNIVNKAMKHPEIYNPSMAACRFCNVKMTCVPRSKWLKQQQALVIAASKAPANVNQDRYLDLLEVADAIGQAIKDVRAYAEEIIRAGGKFGDYKMVNGRANRKWLDLEEAKEFMSQYGKKAYTKKFVTVPQAEKVDRTLKKDDYFLSLWEKTPGKPILVKGSDKRKALTYGTDSAFAKYIE